ncbi:hypothetical protein EV645_5136 [Kribbella rubisoli]|uniref:Uncharacterized protein n=1 Tax=Kribbella rubisoli TaxID=3075929 RepID=A0A4Q7WX57_9ACTN|nr:hypothetical protein [Kribbella rubisoli]RZU14265.1 hypothetical protein EV645_5136 [Kribbella rubisoli]
MSQDVSDQPEEQKKGGPIRALASHPLLVAVVPAVISVAATLLLGANGQLPSAVRPEPSVVTTTATTTVTASASAADTESTPAASPSSGAAAPVMHAGKLDLALNASADLDSPSIDATWRVISLPQGASADINWQGGGLFVRGDAQGFVSSATRPSCQTSSGYGTNFLELQNKPLGTFLCIYTNEKHYSLLKLTRDDGNDGASFEVTTYN